jgi:DNA end-binding protein Ku
MPRSIWKGAIAFGLVNIPVSLTSAESKPEVQFHMVDRKNHARIRYERVNAETGEEVPWDRLVKGYEHEEGEFILLSDDELDAVQPKLTKTIEISEFVTLDDIDPILFEKPYYLEPDKRGRKAYALLREALRKSGKAGISRVVIRTKEYLSAMMVKEDALVLMLLRFPEEIVSAAKLELPSSKSKEWQPVKKEMDLALRLIDEMSGKWKPEEYHDEYRDALMDFIEKKISGGETVSDVKQPQADDEGAGGKVLDLAEYLEGSFKKSGSPAKTKAAGDKPAAKRSATAKSTKKATKTTRKHATQKPAAKKARRSA